MKRLTRKILELDQVDHLMNLGVTIMLVLLWFSLATY